MGNTNLFTNWFTTDPTGPSLMLAGAASFRRAPAALQVGHSAKA